MAGKSRLIQMAYDKVTGFGLIIAVAEAGSLPPISFGSSTD